MLCTLRHPPNTIMKKFLVLILGLADQSLIRYQNESNSVNGPLTGWERGGKVLI